MVTGMVSTKFQLKLVFIEVEAEVGVSDPEALVATAGATTPEVVATTTVVNAAATEEEAEAGTKTPTTTTPVIRTSLKATLMKNCPSAHMETTRMAWVLETRSFLNTSLLQPLIEAGPSEDLQIKA